MFQLTTCVDRIRIPAHLLSHSTLSALHSQIDVKYCNRVLMDIGLVITRYGPCRRITNGSCVPGDGGSHHECLFSLVIFRPFVEEVCVGTIVASTPDGIQVTLGGFFQDIFIPAYWMLRPSHYDESIGLWVWTPNYDDDENNNNNGKEEDENEDNTGDHPEESNDGDGNHIDSTNSQNHAIKVETTLEHPPPIDNDHDTSATATNTASRKEEGDMEQEEEEEGASADRFEMELGSEIRFKVKSIHFTQVTNTAKGIQATTTTTAHSHAFPPKDSSKGQQSQQDQQQQQQQQQRQHGSQDGQLPTSHPEDTTKPLRKRSTSIDVSDVQELPASMHIVASICEDGLGLTSWWAAGEDDEEEEADGDHPEEQDDEHAMDTSNEQGEEYYYEGGDEDAYEQEDV